MGKFTSSAVFVDADVEVGAVPSAFCDKCVNGIKKGVSLKCVIVVMLSLCVVLSAIFAFPFFRNPGSAFLSDDSDAWSADIKASFILGKPLLLLLSNKERLEYEILFELGIPNIKVSIISMNLLPSKNSTNVVFSILPDPKNASISVPALSVLRSYLVDLTLREINLTFTASVFGNPFAFEVLMFPGGITIVPQQSASIWEIPQILFNFTVNSSIVQILEDLGQLDNQLKFGLDLRPYENVYVQLTNKNGSTVEPSVIVQASVLSVFGGSSLEPDRLKQLAHAIRNPHEENLGLDHSVFGKVHGVVLSSYLRHSIESPSPSPSLSPYHAPSPNLAPFAQPPCATCNSFAPVESPNAHSPSMQNLVPPPKTDPCMHPVLPPSSSNFHSQPPSPANYAPSPFVHIHPISPAQMPAPASEMAPLISMPTSPSRTRGSENDRIFSPLTSSAGYTIFCANIWLNWMLLGFVLYLLLFCDNHGVFVSLQENKNEKKKY